MTADTAHITIDDIIAIHGRFLLRYGASWRAETEGTDMAHLRADWLDVLQGLRVYHVAYGLAHMAGSFAPKSHEFRALCAAAPTPAAPPEPLPPPDRARLAIAMGDGLSRAQAEAKREADAKFQEEARRHPGKVWALHLRELDQRGGRVTAVQRAMYRAALASVRTTHMPDGGFTPIPLDALPPGMREDADTRDSVQHQDEKYQ